MGGLVELSRAVGTGAWGIVALGFLCVALTMAASGRPKSRRLTVRVEVEGQEPLKMVHSQVYTPPPHRRNYATNRRRL